MKTLILHAALFTPTRRGWGLPILIEDDPGTAKSSVVEEYADRCDFPCEILSPGERGEGAFGVVPVPVKGILTYPAPDWTARFGEGGIVFVDEVTTAPPLLQAPMLGLLAAKRIGSAQLGPRVRIIGACNRPDQAANGFDLAPPLANRFGWLSWGAPSVEEHTAYMLGAASNQEADKIDAHAEEARVEQAWPAAFARAVGLETAFLQAQPDWKNKCPRASDPKSHRNWPSDRTWEMATRAYASSLVHKLPQAAQEEFTTAFIGAEAFAQWATFIESADLPPVVDLLDGRVQFEHRAARLDRTTAVLNACAAYVTSPKAEKKAPRADALWDMLAKVGSNALDVVVPVAQQLIRAHLHTSKTALPILAKIQPAIDAAKAAR